MEPKEPITPAEEDNKTEVIPEEEITEVTTEVKTEAEPKGKTMEEILGEKEDDSVPLATFLELKKEKKEIEKQLKEIKESAEKGATKAEIKEDLKALADKYDVDPNFLADLSTIVYSKAKEEADEVVNSKLKPLEAKDKQEKINKIFNEHYENVMAEMPEYAEVVNKDVIKSLSLLPENAKKTFQQIIEETYGKTVSGKSTMESATPRGGKDVDVDFSKMTDPAYYKQVMQNPELKKKYNEGIAGRLRL